MKASEIDRLISDIRGEADPDYVGAQADLHEARKEYDRASDALNAKARELGKWIVRHLNHTINHERNDGTANRIRVEDARVHVVNHKGELEQYPWLEIEVFLSKRARFVLTLWPESKQEVVEHGIALRAAIEAYETEVAKDHSS